MNLLKALKTAARIVGYTLLFIFGRGEAMREFEAMQNKEALDEANRILKEGDKIRAKYDRARRDTPNVWDSVRTKKN